MDGVLVMSTMVYADEVNDPAELFDGDELRDVDVSERELNDASALVESLTEPFEPQRYEDSYRNQVLDLIDRKASGEELVAPPPPRPRRRWSTSWPPSRPACGTPRPPIRTRHPGGQGRGRRRRG